MIKVLVGGCFDVFHYGHLHFLKEAKRHGDYLVVLLESDKRIKKLKGPSRPIHNESQRKELLESLSFVNKVILTKDEMTDEDYKKVVQKINPQIIAIEKGKKIKTHAETVGAKIVEINKFEGLSSTLILQGGYQPSF